MLSYNYYIDRWIHNSYHSHMLYLMLLSKTFLFMLAGPDSAILSYQLYAFPKNTLLSIREVQVQKLSSWLLALVKIIYTLTTLCLKKKIQENSFTTLKFGWLPREVVFGLNQLVSFFWKQMKKEKAACFQNTKIQFFTKMNW